MRNLLAIIISGIICMASLAQSPHKMSYQAVIFNSNKSIVKNQLIGMKISLLKGSVSGSAVYVETQTATTNDNGLISLEIGSGVVLNGSITNIDWLSGPYFIKIESDITGNTNYTITGITQLLSVPYALHSKSSASLPCLTQAERNLMSAQLGSIIFNKTSNKPNFYDGTNWRNYDYTLTTINMTTTVISSLSSFSADCGGTIITDGGSNIIERGVCWSTSPNPTIVLTTKTTETGGASYKSILTGLSANTKYYVRAYATNNAGTDYGNEISFTTLANTVVGDSFKGGKIAFFLEPGDSGYNANVKHGLIIGAQTNSTNGWGCDNNTFIGTTLDAIGSGLNNTNSIVLNNCGQGSAAYISLNYVASGYDDWYLPSVDELKRISLNHIAIGSYSWSWSSTEKDARNAWYVEFPVGLPKSAGKETLIPCHPVRSF